MKKPSAPMSLEEQERFAAEMEVDNRRAINRVFSRRTDGESNLEREARFEARIMDAWNR